MIIVSLDQLSALAIEYQCVRYVYFDLIKLTIPLCSNLRYTRIFWRTMDPKSFIEKCLSYAGKAPFFGLAADVQEQIFILKRIKAKLEGSFELRVLSAPGQGLKELREALFQKELFASKTLILLENVDLLPKTQVNEMQTLLQGDLPNSVLLCFNRLNVSNLKSLFFSAKVQLDLLSEKPWDTKARFANFAKGYLQDNGLTIEQEALQLLVQSAHEDILFLENELQKLVSYVQGKEKVSMEDIQEIAIITEESSGWQIGEGLLRRDLPYVATSIYEQSGDEAALMGVVHQIRYMIRQYTEIKSLWDNEKDIDRIQKLYPAMRLNKLKKVIELLQTFSIDQLKETLSKLIDFEILVKSHSFTFENAARHLFLLLENTIGMVHV